MAIWMEIHCDAMLGGQHPKDILRPRCMSAENRNPMGRTHNNQAAVIRLMTRLADESKAKGWVKQGGQWACPGCAGRENY